tara:strand:+ start:359 stop:643 length:285 start_codon:yes stop_codon:yes gene_type:complete
MARKRGAKSDSPANEPEPVSESPQPEPEPQAPKTKRASVKMTDKQKADLKKHMEKHKDLQDLNVSQLKSHRMKMMSKMRQGKSLAQAHKEIMSS